MGRSGGDGEALPPRKFRGGGPPHHAYVILYHPILLYTVLYYRISAGLCLSRANRLRAVCCNLSVPSPSNHVNHKLTIKFSIYFQSFPVLQSAISSLPIWYQLLAVCFDLLTCLLDPTGDPVTLTGVGALNPVPPRVRLKIITFQACLQHP